MTEPIKISSYDWHAPMAERPSHEGMRLLFIPLMVFTFIAGLLVGVQIDKDRPVASDPGFVNIEGHGGEILVVGPDGSTVQWTTEDQLHREAGHG
jgi:hypothetical protein